MFVWFSKYCVINVAESGFVSLALVSRVTGVSGHTLEGLKCRQLEGESVEGEEWGWGHWISLAGSGKTSDLQRIGPEL